MAEQTILESNDVVKELDVDNGSWVRRLGWIRCNVQRQAELETRILSKVSSSAISRRHVQIDNDQHIWTLIVRRRDTIRQSKSLSALSALAATSLNATHSMSSISDTSNETVVATEDSNKTQSSDQQQSNTDEAYESRSPLVLVHGMGSSAALFVKNFDALAANRVVYAIDLPGFGRSSRQKFADESERVEEQFVESIERWRIEMKIDKFILLGHSFGGYVITLYALKYPDRVKHMILADPWGFPGAPSNGDQLQQLPLFLRVIRHVVSPTFPFALLRVAGPLGPTLVERFRPDLHKMYADLFDDNTVLDYIYECNALEPSGENAFKSLCSELAWARRPLIERAHHLSPRVGMTFIYGERSWIDSASGYLVRSMRPASHVRVHVLPKAAHHVMAQCSDLFNKIVDRTCEAVDNDTLDSLLNDPLTRGAAERPRSNSDESLTKIGKAVANGMKNGISPRSNSNLEGLPWLDAKPKTKDKRNRLWRSKSKSEESKVKIARSKTAVGSDFDDDDEEALSDETRKKGKDSDIHPRLKFFPPNQELPPGLLKVEVRPISF